MSIVLLVVGLVLLVAGAELLVRGASALAAALGVSPLVIGLTIVACGTSAPELAVSVKSALAGQQEIALGNVVGSNIFNVLAILGLSALITPLVVHQQLIRLDVPLMIVASAALWLMGLDGAISRLDATALLLAAVGYTLLALHLGRREDRHVQQEYAQAMPMPHRSTGGVRLLLQVVMIAAGLALLVLGARWLVTGAAAVAARLGVSELVIGLTIVAAGTSLPEVATSVLAAIRGQRDIAVGNVVGSNLFNILAILGTSAMISPGGELAVSPTALAFDIPVMTAVAVACLPVFFTGHRISRWEGGLFLGYYVAYAAYLVLRTGDGPGATALRTVMLWFVIPLTVITLAIGLVRAIRKPSAG